MRLNTFSIVARCARTGRLGGAVSTAVPAVGAICPHVRAGVGAVASQSWANPYLALDALDLLADDVAAAVALHRVVAADEGRELRQVGVVDAGGGSAA